VCNVNKFSGLENSNDLNIEYYEEERNEKSLNSHQEK
jgi:hypothetical protein